jgi:hypothetical protein
MVGLYFLFILQAFCLFHAYKSRTDQKWYWIIIFFPYVGCIIYLYDAFYTRRAVTTVAEGLKQVVNTNYRTEHLEREVNFSDNTKNKILLADEYVVNGRFNEAVDLYESCRDGYMVEDEPLKRKLMHALFLDKQYDKAVVFGEELKGTKDFRNAMERISLACAYQSLGRTEEAEKHFSDMDRTFTNYPHRFSYCEFLLATDRKDKAKEKLNELLGEIEQMKGPERRVHRDDIRRIEELRRSLNASNKT